MEPLRELSWPGHASRADTVREVASSLFAKKINSSKAPTFASGARDIFAAAVEARMRRGTGALDNAGPRTGLNAADVAELRRIVEDYPDLRWINIYMHREDSATTQSFLSPLLGVVNDVFTSHFAEPGGDFSIREAMSRRGGRAVFLEYDIVNSSLLDTVYTVLLDLAAKEALGNTDETRHAYFVLDEFPLIPQLTHIDSLLNFGRGREVRVIAGVQNVSQVRSAYGEALAASILSGFSTYAAFRLFDEESRRFTSERHGAVRRLVSLPYADGLRSGTHAQKGSVKQGRARSRSRPGIKGRRRTWGMLINTDEARLADAIRQTYPHMTGDGSAKLAAKLISGLDGLLEEAVRAWIDGTPVPDTAADEKYSVNKVLKIRGGADYLEAFELLSAYMSDPVSGEAKIWRPVRRRG